MPQYVKYAILSLILTCLTTATSYAREISVETLDWPPQVGPNIPEQGLNTALVRAAFEAVGHSIKVTFVPWSRALKNVLEGRADVVISAYYTKQRDNDYYMSDVINYVDVGLIARPGLDLVSYKSLKELRPYSIGVVRGYANAEEFDAADYLDKHQVSTPTLNIRKLYRGRIDLAAMSFDRFRFEAEKEGFCTGRVTFVDPPLHREGLYVMASRAVPYGKQIAEDFNRGLKIIRANGTFDKIVNRLGR